MNYGATSTNCDAQHLLFIVHPDKSEWPGHLAGLSARELVRRANVSTATQAIDHVFATSGDHFALAKRHLRKP